MTRLICAVVLTLLAATPATRLSAQLLNAAAPIRVGHYHLNVTSIDEHKKFWVDTMGGTAVKIGSTEAVRFGDVFLLLRQQKPTGPTRGTTFDHIGLAVPNVPEFAKNVVSKGYGRTVGRETGAGPGANAGPSPVYGAFEYLVGPDGVKIELVTNKEPNAPPIVHHHVHFINTQFVEMGRWYMKALNATERSGATNFFFGADLPGIGYMLNFFNWERKDATPVGTSGRAVDHVGFEVRNLKEFLGTLPSKDIKLTTPLARDPALGAVNTAVITDPWGTVVELTEGLEQAAR